MSSIQMQIEDIQRKVEEYKNSAFIKKATYAINRIAQLATPRAIIDLKTGEIKIDIDEVSKSRIEYWQQEIEVFKEIFFKETKAI